MPQQAGPDQPSPEFQKMQKTWQLIDDLCGGTEAMHAAGVRWLPREQSEAARSYEDRLERTILFNALKDSVEKVKSRPFSRSIILNGKLPESLRGIESNPDRSGTSLKAWVSEQFKDKIKYGLSHYIVDFPKTGGGQSRASEQSGTTAPYFVRIPPTCLFAWSKMVGEDGTVQPAQIRYYVDEMVREGDFGQEHKRSIRVWDAPMDGNPGQVRTFVRGGRDNSGWVLDPDQSAVHTYPGIPLVTDYAIRTGFMTADPPFNDLAWMNLAHYRSDSDQRNSLHFSRFTKLMLFGFSEQEQARALETGPMTAAGSERIEARAEYIETKGSALEMGRQDLADLEKRMQVLGMQPFVAQSGRETARAKEIDEEKSTSQARTWVEDTESAVRKGYEVAARWMGLDLPEDFAVSIFKDFAIPADTSDIRELRETWGAGGITHRTFLAEMQRRNMLSERVDIDEEAAKVAAEQEAMQFPGE